MAKRSKKSTRKGRSKPAASVRQADKERLRKSASNRDASTPQGTDLPWWKNLLLGTAVVLVIVVAGEALLGLVGVEPVFYEEDPYVGFSSYAPLYVESKAPDGTTVMSTAENKLSLFNASEFKRDKADDGFRIFCLGGSTTYGRPYGDSTSFCGWLREMLPVADPSKHWEVINAGGISYASYRISALTEELIEYEPDLFIVYTGHNEFLERRTYHQAIHTPAPVRGLATLASRTRIYSAMKNGFRTLRSGKDTADGEAGATVLDARVETMLDSSVGPDAYERDETWRQQVIDHFRFSLSRIVDIAESAGAGVVLASPGSNFRHFTPFKSEHRSGLSAADAELWEAFYEQSETAADNSDWPAALAALDAAAEIDRRYAELHFLRGSALDALGRYAEARQAFARACEEDICPLRAVQPLQTVIAEVARERQVPWVDIASLVERQAPQGIPGEEQFFDHVHPTIELHRRIALEFLGEMENHGLVELSPDWGPEAVARIQSQVESTIDRGTHARALFNVAKVIAWAGKLEEAYRIGLRVIELAPDDPQPYYQTGICAHLTERLDEAETLYRRAIALEPGFYTAHGNLGAVLEKKGDLDGAARHYRHAWELTGPSQAGYKKTMADSLAALGASPTSSPG